MTESEATTTDLEFHPLANLFPLMEGADFDELVQDIREHGLQEPIVLLDGKIIDGRNRYRACLAAGLPKHDIFTTASRAAFEDPLTFVISRNLHRRHLTTQQRAAIAAELANMKLGDNQHTNANEPPSNDGPSPPKVSTATAAKMMNVGTATVERAKQLMRTDPEAHAKAKAGALPRHKPSKPEKRLRQNLGARRATAFIERHPEMNGPADNATVVDIEWLKTGPIDAVSEWMVNVLGRPRLDDLFDALTAPQELSDERQMDIEDLMYTDPAPQELSEELVAEQRLRDARAEGGRRRLEEALAHVAEQEAAQGNGELRNDPVELGRRVRDARQARGWTQGILADAAGTHGPIISQIERGKLERVGKATLQRVTEAVL